MSKDKFSPNAIESINDDWGKDLKDSYARGFSGQSVQDFIKSQLNSKMGTFYHDEQANVYLVFASQDTLKEYLEDTTKTDLILGRFDAPLNYSVFINYKNAIRQVVFVGSKGNTLDFDFVIKDKNNNPTGESVTVVYTVTKDKIATTYTNIYDYGTEVHKNIDEWLKEGTTTINIKVTGNNTLASNNTTVTFVMVSLSLEDEYDISKVCTDESIAIPYSISGYGTKYLEWYLDGQKVEYNQDEDEILQASSASTKYINASSLSNGLHTIQFRAYISVEGEKLYTDTHVVTAIVHASDTNFPNKTVLALKYTLPKEVGINESITPTEFNIYNATQFVPYNISFGTYSAKNIAKTNVQVYVVYGDETYKDDDLYSTITSSNNKVNNISITFIKIGFAKVIFYLGEDNVYIGNGSIDKNINNIQEITTDLDFLFSPKGKTNSSSNKDEYVYNGHDVTFIDFAWNNSSGWVNNALKFNSGNSISCNITPLKDDAMAKGKTFEFYIKSSAVFDDNYVFCDLTTDGHGIKLTASDFIVTSEGGKSIHVNYPNDEYVRLTAVINRRTGATNKGLMFIYVNGEITAAINVILSDYIRCDKQLVISASDGAKLDIKEIRIYDAPLSAEQVLNNYILCQDSVEEMTKIYDRNDILDESGAALSVDKLSTQCPVMIITGSIPTLENTNNKKEQIIVDVQYVNVQDPTKSFTMKNAAMRPQGTSSMSYPKKNFKLYTRQVDNTEVYDYEGNLIEDKLYAFKDNAQPVDIWCLKADYAESSGTHNTGIARLWNQVMYDAVIDGEHKLRTTAQTTALTNGYNYDVRTTVDGFPINLFYRLNENSELVYIGKYNFNNDKSTESVYGFRDIPGFDNSNVECWEVLNNGDAIALFKSVINFDKLWSNAFEARYPDGSTKIDNLKAFCTWVSKANGKLSTFKTQKWEHLDVYKVAAYYVYLMRFCAVDQTVKNAMLTTEDGQHYFFINYDNDTINGVINTGELSAPYDTDRNTIGSDGSYIFAGHDSVLWNMLEQDSEFKEIVLKVDAALYQAGLTYDKVIDMFDNKQAGSWNERVYNRDAQYKYLTPYTSNGINNLFMLQGSRSSHRKYFLKKRFTLFDSMFVSGALKSNVFEIKFTNDTPANQAFTITAGTKLYYGYGINELVTESGIKLEHGETHTFNTPRVLNLGDPVRIYGVTELQGIDLSACSDRVNQLSVSSSSNCPYLTSLILGGSKTNTAVSEISGITKCINLKTLDIRGYKSITSLDLSQLSNLEKLYLNNSGVTNIQFASGANINYIQFNNLFTSINFESLPNLSSNGLDNINWSNINSISIIDCPKLTNDNTIFNNWLSVHTSYDANTSIIMDNINWSCTAAQVISYGTIKTAGGILNLKGKISLDAITEDEYTKIVAIYGENVFSSANELWISAPDNIMISGPTDVIEEGSFKYTITVFSQEEGGTNKINLTGLSGADNWDNDTTTLTLVEQGKIRTINIFVIHQAPSGKLTRCVYTINVKTITYSIANGVKFEIINSTTSKFNIITTNGQKKVITDIILDDTLTAKFNITEKNLNEGYLLCTNEAITEIITGNITIKYKTSYNQSSSISKSITCTNDNMLLTDYKNKMFLTNLKNKGIIANNTYITKEEISILSHNETGTIYICNDIDYTFFEYLNKDDTFTLTVYLYNNKNITIPKNVTVSLYVYDTVEKITVYNLQSFYFDISSNKNISEINIGCCYSFTNNVKNIDTVNILYYNGQSNILTSKYIKHINVKYSNTYFIFADKLSEEKVNAIFDKEYINDIKNKYNINEGRVVLNNKVLYFDFVENSNYKYIKLYFDRENIDLYVGNYAINYDYTDYVFEILKYFYIKNKSISFSDFNFNISFILNNAPKAKYIIDDIIYLSKEQIKYYNNSYGLRSLNFKNDVLLKKEICYAKSNKVNHNYIYTDTIYGNSSYVDDEIVEEHHLYLKNTNQDNITVNRYSTLSYNLTIKKLYIYFDESIETATLTVNVSSVDIYVCSKLNNITVKTYNDGVNVHVFKGVVVINNNGDTNKNMYTIEDLTEENIPDVSLETIFKD